MNISIKYIFIAALCLCANFSFAAMDPRAMYEQGLEAFKSGNYGSSELLFKKIKDFGGSEYIDRAWYYLALSIFNKKRYESALFEFKNFLNNCKSDDLAARSRYWMGECYFYLNEYSNAIEEYKRYISQGEEGEDVPAAHDRIGSMYLFQQRYDEAVLEWREAVSRDRDPQQNALRQFRIGEAYFRGGRHNESLRELYPLVSGDAGPKTSSSARMVCGRIYQEKNSHQKALVMFNGVPENLMDEEPFNDVRFLKARSYRELGNIPKARILLEAFIPSGKNSQWYHEALYELGAILLQGEDREKGLALLEKTRAESKKPSLRAQASNLIGGFFQERQPEKAIPYLKESLEAADPARKNGLIVLLGGTCMRAKKFAEALEFFDLYLRENPFDKRRDEIIFLKARVYFEMGNIDAAIMVFEAIRKENPFSQYTTESGYYLGMIEYKKGNLSRSISLLSEYIKRKSATNSFDAHVLLAQVYLGKDELEKAGKIADVLARDFIGKKDVEVVIKDFAIALQRKGRDATKYINLLTARFPESPATAELYLTSANENFDKGNYDAALNYFDRYLAGGLNKSLGDAFYKRLVSLFRLKRFRDVIAAIKKGNFPPMSEDQWNEIPLIQARAYYYMNKFDEVYILLDLRLIRGYPRDDILMYIKCALKTGDQRSAMEASVYLESDREIFSEALYALGDFFFSNDNMDQAELFFLRLIRECPGSKHIDQAKVSLAAIYMRNKKYQAAVNILSEVSAEDARDRKNALLIVCYFDMNLDDKAIAFTREHLDELLSGDYGQEAVRYNLDYYYRKKDLQQFDRYVKYLSRYGGNEFIINYLSGKLYFEKGNYYKSHGFFLALSRTTNRYYGESLYYLGIYNLLVNRHVTQAISYFSRIVDLVDVDPTVRLRAMIHLAIIYKERNDNDKARALLKDVLTNKERGLFFIQAGNLYEAFGYSGM